MKLTAKEEVRLTDEIKKAVEQGKSSIDFINDKGEKIHINLEKMDEKGICTPYDHF